LFITTVGHPAVSVVRGFQISHYTLGTSDTSIASLGPLTQAAVQRLVEESRAAAGDLSQPAAAV